MKPYTPEIIKLMAAHSPLSAAYASVMKWDFWRRQKIEDIKLVDIAEDCGFCLRGEFLENVVHSRKKCKKCELFVKQGWDCDNANAFYNKAAKALKFQDQQAFTQSANDLYYLICKIIDDLYKPKPEPKKEEKFYHTGQQFTAGSQNASLVSIGNREVLMVNAEAGTYWGTSKMEVGDPLRITEAEFKRMCRVTTFTLIEAKKC